MSTTLKAPKGKYRVVGVDTFAHEDYRIGDFDTLQAAIDKAKEAGGEMHKTHVYDDTGRHHFSAGTF